MNTLAAISLLLIAFDGPVGSGIPELVTRFENADSQTISASFVGDAAASAEIEWFLDGNGVLAPVAVNVFLPAGESEAGSPVLEGTFPVKLPEISRPTLFRGLIYATDNSGHRAQVGQCRLLLYPENHLDAEWGQLAESDVPIVVSGPFPGLREFLDNKSISYREGDLDRPETLERSGFLIAQWDGQGRLPIRGLAKSMVIYGAGLDDAMGIFGEATGDEVLTWIANPPSRDFDDDPIAQQIFLRMTTKLIDLNNP